LEVKAKDDDLLNETQSLGLLNVNQILPKIELRIGTLILFYFTDLYF